MGGKLSKKKHGGWGRYRLRGGELEKLCTGPLHPPNGAWLSVDKFWTFKKVYRKGKLFSRCIECERFSKGRDPIGSGYVPVKKIWWVFEEIERRVGKTDGCRRLKITGRQWLHYEQGTRLSMHHKTARKAIKLLHELRKDKVVRHKKSIKHGAYVRGHREQTPSKHSEFYSQQDDHALELKKKRITPEQKEKMREKDRERKRNRRKNL